MNLLHKAIDFNGIDGVANFIGVHRSSVKRWIETDKNPEQYNDDLKRLLRIPIEEGKDKYYTSSTAAKQCWELFTNTATKLNVNLQDYTFIEPSAGAGAFYDLLPKDRRIGVDISPHCEGLIKADYLTWTPPNPNKYIVIGNPPFGLRGHLALQFINHSYNFADMVAFILPQLFVSDGKGVPAKRVKSYSLAHTSPIDPNSFHYPDGSTVAVESIFQVWTRVGTDKIDKGIEPPTCDDFVNIYSVSDGGTPDTTRNKKMIGKCDIYIPSTCFNGMRTYDNFHELPNNRGYGIVIKRDKEEILNLLRATNWEDVAFLSTNRALCMRLGLIANVITNAGFIDDKLTTLLDI